MNNNDDEDVNNSVICCSRKDDVNFWSYNIHMRDNSRYCSDGSGDITVTWWDKRVEGAVGVAGRELLSGIYEVWMQAEFVQ